MAPSTSTIAEMKTGLLRRYASSAFHKCTHQPLPRMDGPPVEIHPIDSAIPRKVSTPVETDLDRHWWKSIELLETVSRSGIVLNPEKFQICAKDVEFAGFRITSTRVAPLPKYLDSTRLFPTPKSLTDIRSWFGLINQVAGYGQLRKTLDPFRPFLSPKVKFEGTATLLAAFEAGKLEIVKAIETGVEIVDQRLPTCLRTDWSKAGTGYYLCQKVCNCASADHGRLEDMPRGLCLCLLHLGVD